MSVVVLAMDTDHFCCQVLYELLTGLPAERADDNGNDLVGGEGVWSIT